MYDPVKDGVTRTVESVVYTEAPPPASLSELVHCFWELRTVTDMAEIAAMPPRQLQRALKATTGFTPHDLWKVLRVQHSFRRGSIGKNISP
jgi:AraC-like DNA-binding protein